MRLVLVLAERDRLRARQEHERAELVAVRGEHAVVEVGERDDELDSVLGDERGERRDVARVVDGRDGRAQVGGVERGRELVRSTASVVAPARRNAGRCRRAARRR